jgi:hypothetical protein
MHRKITILPFCAAVITAEGCVKQRLMLDTPKRMNAVTYKLQSLRGRDRSRDRGRRFEKIRKTDHDYDHDHDHD